MPCLLIVTFSIVCMFWGLWVQYNLYVLKVMWASTNKLAIHKKQSIGTFWCWNVYCLDKKYLLPVHICRIVKCQRNCEFKKLKQSIVDNLVSAFQAFAITGICYHSHLTFIVCQRKVVLVGQSQVRGHNVADLDPLGIFAADLDTSEVPELLPHTYALGKAQQNCWFPRAALEPLHAYICLNVAFCWLWNDFWFITSEPMCHKSWNKLCCWRHCKEYWCRPLQLYPVKIIMKSFHSFLTVCTCAV